MWWWIYLILPTHFPTGGHLEYSIMPLRTHIQVSVWTCFSGPWAKYLGVELLYGNSHYLFEERLGCFPGTTLLAFPPVACEDWSYFSTSSPTPSFSTSAIYFLQPPQWVWSVSLWGAAHAFMCSPNTCVSSWEQSLCRPRACCLLFYFTVELFEFFTYSRTQGPLRCTICKYFPSASSFPPVLVIFSNETAYKERFNLAHVSVHRQPMQDGTAQGHNRGKAAHGMVAGEQSQQRSREGRSTFLGPPTSLPL